MTMTQNTTEAYTGYTIRMVLGSDTADLYGIEDGWDIEATVDRLAAWLETRLAAVAPGAVVSVRHLPGEFSTDDYGYSGTDPDWLERVDELADALGLWLESGFGPVARRDEWAVAAAAAAADGE